MQTEVHKVLSKDLSAPSYKAILEVQSQKLALKRCDYQKQNTFYLNNDSSLSRQKGQYEKIVQKLIKV